MGSIVATPDSRLESAVNRGVTTIAQPMNALQRVAASILAVAALSAAGETRTTPFSHLGARSALQLRGPGGSATLDFGSRSDELVTGARLRFRYSWSPAL